MDKFVARENIKHCLELLKRPLNETERQRVLGLLQEEEAKLKKASEPVSDPEMSMASRIRKQMA
jgi:hypothetical protein